MDLKQGPEQYCEKRYKRR